MTEVHVYQVTDSFALGVCSTGAWTIRVRLLR